jgi:hypothetical protein
VGVKRAQGLLPCLDRLKIAGPLERHPTALLNGWQKVELACT